MRKSVALVTVAMLVSILSYATLTYGFTVTYSQDGEKVCPANATFTPDHSECYCNSGYKVKGTSCVKDEPSTAAANEIYRDVFTAVSLNDNLTCAQMGLINTVDVGMCTKYKAAPDPAKWTIIDRPSVSTQTGILNPWAPSSQLTMTATNASVSTSSTSTPAAPPPAPLPPPPAPEPTPPPPEPEPVKALPAPKKVEELEAKPVAEEMPAPTPIPAVDFVPPVQAAPEQNQAFSQVANVQSILSSLKISPDTGGLVPLVDDKPAPETPTEPEKKQSLLGRIFGWLFSIF